jgi:dihydroflavonol-4-reductase
MKSLVTGASGFTGSHLVRRLLARGDEVVAYVRPSSDRSRLNGLPIEFADGAITDKTALNRAMQGVEQVFHVAAYVELGLVDADLMTEVNVTGTQRVLASAQLAGVKRMIHCSTIGIYGDTQGRKINETFVREQQGFSSAYDRTKFEGQQWVDEAARNGFNVVSVMPSGIFGPGDPHFGPVVQQFLRGGLKVWAAGDRVTGIVHVEDLVEAMILAIEKGNCGDHFIISAGELTTHEMFGVFNQVTGIPVPKEVPEPLVRIVGRLLDPIGRLLRWQPPISRERVHYLYDRCVRVDASKARQALGWTPRSVETTLQELVQSQV